MVMVIIMDMGIVMMMVVKMMNDDKDGYDIIDNNDDKTDI